MLLLIIIKWEEENNHMIFLSLKREIILIIILMNECKNIEMIIIYIKINYMLNKGRLVIIECKVLFNWLEMSKDSNFLMIEIWDIN